MLKNHLLFNTQVEQLCLLQNIPLALQCTGAFVFSSSQNIFYSHILVSNHCLHIIKNGPPFPAWNPLVYQTEKNHGWPNQVSMEYMKSLSFDFLPKTGSQCTTTSMVHCCGEESMSYFPSVLATSFIYTHVNNTRSQCRTCQWLLCL